MPPSTDPPLAELHGLARLLARSADRLAARSFAAGRLGPECLPPLLGTWSSAEAIDWGQLPPGFVLKASQGRFPARLVPDRARADLAALRAEAAGWLDAAAGPSRPLLFAEALLRGRDGGPAPAWRFRLRAGRLESLSDRRPDPRIRAAAARLAAGLPEARIRLHLIGGEVIFGSIRRD
jgi:hypothetical protein